MKNRTVFILIATISSLILLFFYWKWGFENAPLYILIIWIVKDIWNALFEKKKLI